MISFITYTQGLFESQDELKTFLSLISPSLREEVLKWIFAKTLNVNPIFKGNDDLIQFITTKLNAKNHLPEDTIIRQGEEGDALYFIAKGEWKVYVRDHKGVTDPVNIIHPGELFGEVALIWDCKRTATVKTRNYSTLAFIIKSVFHDMCEQYSTVYKSLRVRMRVYDDGMKRFIKNQLKTLPYASGISDDTLEEISYLVKHEYYENNKIVFRSGDPTTKVYFVTMGEVDIFREIGNKEFLIDTLYQGWWLGAYKVLNGDKHVFTMRAGSDTTLHYLTKDSISLLMNNYSDFNKEIIRTQNYMKYSKDPFVDYYWFKPKFTEIDHLKYLKLIVVKIIGWRRKIKGINKFFNKLEANNFGYNSTIEEFLESITVNSNKNHHHKVMNNEEFQGILW